MKNTPSIDVDAQKELLYRFNRREVKAFGEVYSLFHRELIYFAARLFKGAEISGEDAVQDIFASIWEDRRCCFDEIGDIKGYIYAGIKNKFRNHIKHLKHIEKHQRYVFEQGEKAFLIAETEVFSILTRALEILPEECARVFKLHLDGWNVKEIAQKLNKSESTVYTQRQEAINHLRKKLSTGDFSFFTFLFL